MTVERVFIVILSPCITMVLNVKEKETIISNTFKSGYCTAFYYLFTKKDSQ